MSQALHYEIKIKGQLGAHWSQWFENFSLEHESGGLTVLSGPVRDNAALFGLLERIRDLGLTLISVNPRPAP